MAEKNEQAFEDLLSSVCGEDRDPRTRVLGFIIDDETEKAEMFTNDLLVNQLRSEGPAIAASFDAAGDEVLWLWSELDAKAFLLLRAGLFCRGFPSDELRAEVVSLMNTARVHLNGAATVLRYGYRAMCDRFARVSA